MAHVNPVQIQKFLKGVDYPASKAALIETAKKHGADDNVCSSLEQLPDEDFQTPADVSQAFGRMPGDVPGGESSQQGQQSQRQQSGASSGTSQEAGEFLSEALEDSMAEVELCELALQKTENDDVKVFAQKMIDDHSNMGREIEKLAGRKHSDMPRDIKPEHKKRMEELSKLEGRDFDKRFIEANIKDHSEDVKKFSEIANKISDQTVKSFAEKSVKILSGHLKMAEDINRKMSH